MNKNKSSDVKMIEEGKGKIKRAEVKLSLMDKQDIIIFSGHPLTGI
jgi:hypothetical protein